MTDIRWLCTVTILLTVIVAVAVWLSGSGRWLLEQMRPVEEAELTPVSDGYQSAEEYLAERGREFPALYETPPPAPVEGTGRLDDIYDSWPAGTGVGTGVDVTAVRIERPARPHLVAYLDVPLNPELLAYLLQPVAGRSGHRVRNRPRRRAIHHLHLPGSPAQWARAMTRRSGGRAGSIAPTGPGRGIVRCAATTPCRPTRLPRSTRRFHRARCAMAPSPAVGGTPTGIDGADGPRRRRHLAASCTRQPRRSDAGVGPSAQPPVERPRKRTLQGCA